MIESTVYTENGRQGGARHQKIILTFNPSKLFSSNNFSEKFI